MSGGEITRERDRESGRRINVWLSVLTLTLHTLGSAYSMVSVHGFSARSCEFRFSMLFNAMPVLRLISSQMNHERTEMSSNRATIHGKCCSRSTPSKHMELNGTQINNSGCVRWARAHRSDKRKKKRIRSIHSCSPQKAQTTGISWFCGARCRVPRQPLTHSATTVCVCVCGLLVAAEAVALDYL